MRKIELNKKRIAALLASGVMMTFTGCSKSDDNNPKIINQYNLSDTFVVTRSDDTADIAKKIYVTGCKDHNHYRSRITDEIYSTNKCDVNETCYTFFPAASAGTMAHYSQLSSKDISYYLTTDEKLKIKNEEFTKEDEEVAIKRIFEEILKQQEESQEEQTTESAEEVETIEEIASSSESDITYDLSELYISKVTNPAGDGEEKYYIFKEMDENDENYTKDCYKEYHGEFFVVPSYSLSAQKVNTPNCVIAKSIGHLSYWLETNQGQTLDAFIDKQTQQVTEKQLEDILNVMNGNYIDLSKTYISKTTTPTDSEEKYYIFEEVDYCKDAYKAYNDGFYVVPKDSQSAKFYYYNPEDWNPLFIITDSVEEIGPYLTEEEIQAVKEQKGYLTKSQLESILNRIRDNNKFKDENKNWK